jgi:GTP cyclohydrolase II
VARGRDGYGTFDSRGVRRPMPSSESETPEVSSSTTPAGEHASSNPIPSRVSGSPIPIVRIHSECYTGETIGSMRCDCGEQLDEAIRYISQPQPHPRNPRQLVHGRGAVIYMRQEGRGIGLLEKIRAYNLQDMGHDTVSANLLLGHEADERGYDVAAAIMRDLGLDREIRLLTNNPDKMEALRKEGIIVKERLPMVPRTWTAATHAHLSAETSAAEVSFAPSSSVPVGPHARVAGATMIGGGSAYGVDLEKYLRTKVLRMGHLLELPTPSNPQPTHEIVIPSSPPSAFGLADSPVVTLRPLQHREGTQ